ncbi:MAG: DUF4874 domain-containing protein [Oscillospiraceae bacterium]|jgi:hypothetical protein|nr:DUF4874 domain-containing protein [Oscillospiraceae bacterium]
MQTIIRLFHGVIAWICILLGIIGGSAVQNLTPAPLSGADSALLLDNPNRGFRMEVNMDVSTGLALWRENTPALETLHREYNLYASDKPMLSQVYFYLTDYLDRDLDETAFANMNRYFDELETLGIHAVLRFAYIWDDSSYEISLSQEPTQARILRHLEQLKPFLAEHRGQILVLQAGLLGPWGEWSSEFSKNIDEKAILYGLLDAAPGDMQVQVRYSYDKTENISVFDQSAYNRIGYHDDFLIDRLHFWNTAGDNIWTLRWLRMTLESANLLIDGESIWGAANGEFLESPYIDPLFMANRLSTHHFTSFSMTHNYKEDGDDKLSMQYWQEMPVTAKELQKNKLLVHPSWFKDAAGTTIERNWFDYIRDSLGYYLVVENAEVVPLKNNQLGVRLTLRNYGFAAPLGLNAPRLVLLDAAGKEVAAQTLCDPAALQPNKKLALNLKFADVPANARLAIALTAPDGTPARLANEITFEGGYNILGTLA